MAQRENAGKRIISSIIKIIKPAGQKCEGRIVTAEPKITALVSSQDKERVISYLQVKVRK